MMKRPIRDGFGVVWRHQRLLWWIFFVSLALGLLAAAGPRILFHSLLNKSLYSQELSERFDLTVFLELLSKPEVSLNAMYGGSTAAAFVFVIYMLFVSGGVLTVYRDDRKLGRGEFFEASGDYFWRMFRLMLCAVIPFGIVMALFSVVEVVSGKMTRNASWEKQGFWVAVGGYFICALIALFVRAWFDVAQARTVCERARGMFVLTFRAFVLALRNLPGLTLIYAGISLIGTILVAGTWFIWLHIPHQSFGRSWLLLELLTLMLIGLRLWQRAASLLWYENYLETHATRIALPPGPPLAPEPLLVAEQAREGPLPSEDRGFPVT
jgi:hypothetical protein